MKKILGLAIGAILIIGLVAGGTWAYFQDTEASNSNSIAAGTLDLTWNGTNDVGTAVFAIAAANGYPGNSGTAAIPIKNVGSFAGELDVIFASLNTNTESNGATEYEFDAASDVAGTSTSGSTTTLVDSGAAWTVNQYAGYTVYVNSEKRTIISNTSTTLTFAAGTAVDTDAYSIKVGELANKAKIVPWIDLLGDGDFDDGSDIVLMSDGSASTDALDYAAAADTISAFAGDDFNAVIAAMASEDEYDFCIDWQLPGGGAGSVDNSFQGDACSFNISLVLEQAGVDA